MRTVWLSVPFIILLLILLALGAPMGIKKRSWPWLIAGMVLSFLTVVLPLFVFFLSAVGLPDWKGACRFGWLDCFIEGKTLLAPVVLMATAALYRIEVLRADVTKELVSVVSIYLGATVAWVCFIFTLFYIDFARDIFGPLMIPLYVAVWYTGRAVCLMRAANFGFLNYLVATVITVPFWAMSCIWSRDIYKALPDQQPSGCFVVTAAGRGHRKLVGLFVEVEHGGKRRQANRQLATLWEFENLWRKRFPRSHQHFRQIYNRVGPRIAARIRSPWLADAMFLALKPAEWGAAFCLGGKLSAKWSMSQLPQNVRKVVRFKHRGGVVHLSKP